MRSARPWPGSVCSELARHERRPPTHLYVLCHGLGGTPRDLNVLRDALGADSNAIVHVAKCNAAPQQDAEAAGEVPKFMQYLRVPLVARTYDGVEAGGQRLADEIREVIARHPQLERISLVGNSLGGIYCRYAAALLYSDDDGTLAGLQVRASAREGARIREPRECALRSVARLPQPLEPTLACSPSLSLTLACSTCLPPRAPPGCRASPRALRACRPTHS